jgi:hypothetical protein
MRRAPARRPKASGGETRLDPNAPTIMIAERAADLIRGRIERAAAAELASSA